MIITTNDLNNIETKITTPQIGGIEFIDAVLDENDNINKINASYNDIISILENGKLPVIRKQTSQETQFIFLKNCYLDDDGNHYRYVCTIKSSDSYGFSAPFNNEDLHFIDFRE